MRSMVAALMVLALTGCAQLTAKNTTTNADEARLIQQAYTFEKAGNTRRAMESYRQAVTMSKGAVEAHLALAALLQREGNLGEEQKILEQAYQLQPKNPDVLQNLANNRIANGKAAEALTLLEQAVAAQPDSARAYNSKAIALDMLSRHKEAQTAYRSALSHADGDTAYIQNNLAFSLIQSGKYAEAIPMLEKLCARSDATATMRQNLALAYGVSGKTEKARTLGLKDLKAAEVDENLRYYTSYARTLANMEPAAGEEDSPSPASPKPNMARAVPVAPVAAKEMAPVKKAAPVATEKKPVEKLPEKLPEKRGEKSAAPATKPVAKAPQKPTVTTAKKPTPPTTKPVAKPAPAKPAAAKGGKKTDDEEEDEDEEETSAPTLFHWHLKKEDPTVPTRTRN